MCYIVFYYFLNNWKARQWKHIIVLCLPVVWFPLLLLKNGLFLRYWNVCELVDISKLIMTPLYHIQILLCLCIVYHFLMLYSNVDFIWWGIFDWSMFLRKLFVVIISSFKEAGKKCVMNCSRTVYMNKMYVDILIVTQLSWTFHHYVIK